MSKGEQISRTNTYFKRYPFRGSKLNFSLMQNIRDGKIFPDYERQPLCQGSRTRYMYLDIHYKKDRKCFDMRVSITALLHIERLSCGQGAIELKSVVISGQQTDAAPAFRLHGIKKRQRLLHVAKRDGNILRDRTGRSSAA